MEEQFCGLNDNKRPRVEFGPRAVVGSHATCIARKPFGGTAKITRLTEAAGPDGLFSPMMITTTTTTERCPGGGADFQTDVVVAIAIFKWQNVCNSVRPEVEALCDTNHK